MKIVYFWRRTLFFGATLPLSRSSTHSLSLAELWWHPPFRSSLSRKARDGAGTAVTRDVEPPRREVSSRGVVRRAAAVAVTGGLGSGAGDSGSGGGGAKSGRLSLIRLRHPSWDRRAQMGSQAI